MAEGGWSWVLQHRIRQGYANGHQALYVLWNSKNTWHHESQIYKAVKIKVKINFFTDDLDCLNVVLNFYWCLTICSCFAWDLQILSVPDNKIQISILNLWYWGKVPALPRHTGHLLLFQIIFFWKLGQSIPLQMYNLLHCRLFICTCLWLANALSNKFQISFLMPFQGAQVTTSFSPPSPQSKSSSIESSANRLLCHGDYVTSHVTFEGKQIETIPCCPMTR